MRLADCEVPLEYEQLVDYVSGELSAAEEQRLEEHYFACARCARRLALVEALGAGVVTLVRRGAARASVTRGVAERIAREGLGLRRYVLAPGEVAPCTAAPGDDFVLIELLGLTGTGGARVDVETRVLESGATTQHSLLTALDPETGSISMLFPAEAVRSFPRSRWTLRARVEGTPQAAVTYGLDHTPWPELAHDQRPSG
jgi:hypothetical protein